MSNIDTAPAAAAPVLPVAAASSGDVRTPATEFWRKFKKH